MYWFRRKIEQIKNLIKWFPIIWKQYDFDYRYSIEVLIFQLNKQADFLDSDKAYTVSAKANASSIRRFTRLLKDVYDEKFGMEYMDKFTKQFGEVTIDFKPIPGTEYSEIVNTYPKVDGYTEDQLEDIYYKMLNESNKKQEKAHKLVWKLFERYVRGWWD